MDRTDLRAKLYGLLEEVTGLSTDGIDESTELRSGFAIDSMDLMHLIVEVESKFGVAISGQDFKSIGSIGGLVDVIENQIAGGIAA